MKKIFSHPKLQLAFYLSLIFITSIIYRPQIKVIIILLLCIGAALSLDILLIKIRGVKFFFPEAALVTALIIILLYAPNAPWYEIILVTFIAILAKQFLRIKNRPIFNPAALGLFIGSLLFGRQIAWWGVSWQQFRIQNLQLIIAVLILLTPFLISGFKMKRFISIFVFLVIYTILNRGLVFDPTVIFFALVMLPEPMTTPQKKYQQIFFAIVVAVISVTVSSFSYLSFIPDALVFALLLGNVMSVTYNNIVGNSFLLNLQREKEVKKNE